MRSVYDPSKVALSGNWNQTPGNTTLRVKERLDSPAPAQNTQNQDIVTLNAVDDDVGAHGKASQAGAQIHIATTPTIGMFGKHEETAGNGIG